MKEFRKTEDRLFICEECNNLFKRKCNLSTHISKKHNSRKYFDKWLRDNDDEKCIICGNKTKLNIKFADGYKICCSRFCMLKHRKQVLLKNYGVKNVSQLNRTKETKRKNSIKKYGVEHYVQSEEFKEKSKETLLKHYGVEHPMKNDKIKEKRKQTCLSTYGVKNPFQYKETKEKRKKICLEKYGVEEPFNAIEIREKNKISLAKRKGIKQSKITKEKRKQTCLRKYGVQYSLQNEEVKQKSKQTNRKKYGVDNPSQDKKTYEKGLKTRFKLFQYPNTELTYQGSFEKHFLDTYYEKIDIQNGKSFRYETTNNKNKIYHSDFYIPSKNLIVEIKNSYLAERDKDEIQFKKNAVLNEGYNYIMIVDKDYSSFLR